MPNGAALRAYLRLVGQARSSQLRIQLIRPDAEYVPRRDFSLPHVSVVGGGLAVGYGVRTHGLSLGGQLATNLTATSGRSTEVVIHARAALTVRQAPEFLRLQPDVLSGTVLYCPSFADSLYGYRTSEWEDLLEWLLPELRTSDPHPERVVLTSLPPVQLLPNFGTFTATIAEEQVQALDEVTARVAASHSGVLYLDMAVPTSAQLGAACYATLAAHVAGALRGSFVHMR